MATSSNLDSPDPLRGKLTRVRCLLEDANKQLEEECKIFTTKTSATTISSNNELAANKQNIDKSRDLIKTMNDINTLKTVLSCPIFNRIVNVTDSLDKISYHLNLHPSIGPSDINIDTDGELLLTPPIEQTSLNNLINSKLDQYSEHSNGSPQVISPNRLLLQHNNTPTSTQSASQPPITAPMLIDQNNSSSHHQFNQSVNINNLNKANQSSDISRINETNTLQQTVGEQPETQKHITQTYLNQQLEQLFNINNDGPIQTYVPSPAAIISSLNSYNTEKLVSNGTPKSGGNRQSRQQSTDECPARLYKANGHFQLEQIKSTTATNGVQTNLNNRCQNQSEPETDDSARKNSYANELFKTSQVNNKQLDPIAIEREQPKNNNQRQTSYTTTTNISTTRQNDPLNTVQNSGQNYNRGSCSPSTSAGSTVRLADECDSGASSYQSQTTAPAAPSNNIKSYSNYGYKTTEPAVVEVQERASPIGDGAVVVVDNSECVVDTTSNEDTNDVNSETERIKVTIERGDKGEFGINIAGYIEDDISGIFIRSVIPGSPADKSGKIRIHDQIFAVNGKELLGYGNLEAVEELKRSGKVVTLELMRYLVESKFERLKYALESAPMLSSKIADEEEESAQATNTSSSPTRSSIPVMKSRENNQSPVKSPVTPINEGVRSAKSSSYVQVLSNNGNQQDSHYNNESIYTNGGANKNLPLANKNTNPTSPSHIPVAAQRTNKVIETKQGARNTVEIKSPACQTATATYVSKVGQGEFFSSGSPAAAINQSGAVSKKSLTARLQSEAIATDRTNLSESSRFIRSDERFQWEKETKIIEIYKDPTHGLGFSFNEYIDPRDPEQLIIMITAITPGGIASRDGRLGIGDLLIFVDGEDLEGAGLYDAVKALKDARGNVRLGVLKLIRNDFEID